MKKLFVSVLLIVLVVALGAAYFQWRAQQHGTVTSPASCGPPIVPSAQANNRAALSYPAPSAPPA